MARDISIAISAKDNFSSALTTMRNANQSFKKDLTGLQAKLDALDKTMGVLKRDTNAAKEALKEAEKQFKKTGDEADRLNVEMAHANYENAKRNLKLVSDNAKQAEKDMKRLTEATSKAENRAGSVSGTKGIADEAMKKAAYSQAASLVGGVLSEGFLQGVGSAMGQEGGILASSMLSNAASGAAIGSMIAPGIGTAIGAAGGALLGVVQGGIQVFENRDEAFKSYYEDLYNSAVASQNEALASGTQIASTREMNQMSFATLLGGEEKASEFLSDIVDFATKTPFEYDDLTTISRTLLAYGYQQEEMLPLLTKIGDAGSALGMGAEDMKYVAVALGRIQTTGKTTLEYLNPLLERGIDVWGYLAEASGKTKKEVQEMVSKGLVPGEEAAKAIADYMGAEFSGNMEKQAQTYTGLVSTLQDAKNQMDNAMGEGYNETRKKGLERQIDYLSGENGTQMQEAYKRIGEWKASLENLEEQYQRNALHSVMNGSVSTEFSKEARERLSEMYEEYTKCAEEDTAEAGAKMGELLAEAQVIAQNEYNASEGAQLALASNKSLAENIKNDSAAKDAYWDAGYEMGQQFTKGLTSAMTSEAWYEKTPAVPQRYRNEAPAGGGGMARNVRDPYAAYGANYGKSHAYGLSYVPYDNYPANLHQGERVLTASENRSYGKPSQVSITGNNFIIRQESDIQAVAGEIVRMMENAYITSV